MTSSGRQLGSFERAAVETGKHGAFNAVAVLRLNQTPNFEALRSGVQDAQRREPLLRARVVREGRKLHFQTGAVPTLALVRVERDNDTSWLECVERELATEFDTATGPLARAVLVSGAREGGPCELLVSMHHAIIDATGFVALCRDLLRRGFKETTNPSESFSSASSDVLLVRPDDLFPARFRGLAGRQRLAGYLCRQFADEIGWRLAVRGKRQPPAPATATCRVLPMAVSERMTSDLVRRARSERVALVAALNAALLLAAREILYANDLRPLRYFSFPDLRGSLKPQPPPRALGGYLSVMRFTATMKRIGFWDLARDLHQQLNASFRRGEKFASALAAPMAMRAHLRSRTRMGSVAASYSGPADGANGIAHPALDRLHAFVSNLAIGPEATAQVRIFGGRLLWDFVFLEEDLDRPKMAALVQAIENRLASAVS